MPFGPFADDRFQLMHDNARPHIARVVNDNEYLDTVQIKRMQWPARNLDLNPIEHVWNMIKRQIRARLPAYVNLTGHSIALVQEWKQLDQGAIQHLREGMPRAETHAEYYSC